MPLTATSKRPRNPDFLRRFVRELYGGRCLRCGVDRPLAMAHIASWPVVRASVLRDPSIDPTSAAFWRFHQPANVVLLCCNCHALLDDPKVSELDQSLVLMLRDRAMARSGFGNVVRQFVCRKMGRITRRPVNMNGLAPLMEWLRAAAAARTLEPPYRFVVPWSAQFWHVNLEADEWVLEAAADATLPRWDGNDFVRPDSRWTEA